MSFVLGNHINYIIYSIVKTELIDLVEFEKKLGDKPLESNWNKGIPIKNNIHLRSHIGHRFLVKLYQRQNLDLDQLLQ